jgi:hypothetical protein
MHRRALVVSAASASLFLTLAAPASAQQPSQQVPPETPPASTQAIEPAAAAAPDPARTPPPLPTPGKVGLPRVTNRSGVLPSAQGAFGANPTAPAPSVLPTVEAGEHAGERPDTRVGDFMDTRLSWTFGDDDVLHQTGQAQPISPNASIAERRQYRLFFDNLNSRFAGRENLTHLALYKKMPGFIRNLDTEASLVLRFDIGALSRNTNNLNQSIYDAGSFIRAFYHTDGDPNGATGVGVTFWPLDTDRFRLGYLYDISWGGTNPYINQSIFPRIQGGAPGVKIQYDSKRFTAFLGFKTATIVQVEQTLVPGTSEVEEVKQAQTNYGFLGGVGLDATDMFRVDVGGGYFQQGTFEFPDVAKQPVYTLGGSVRFVVHHKDMQPGQSIDFLLYRNDPDKPQRIFRPERYRPGTVTWSASLEASNLGQNLKDFETAGATAVLPARAAALQANVKAGYLRASLTGIYRDLPFVVRNQPGYIPFQTLPSDADIGSELFFAAAADYHFRGPRLTPGLGLGLQLPATFKTSSLDIASAPIERTVVVREQGNIAILPVNRSAVPIFQARLSLKWDISRILSAIGWVQYVRDNNGTFVGRDEREGTRVIRTFISPDFLGLGTSVQARF